MTTYIGNTPIEKQISSLASFLESVPERSLREADTANQGDQTELKNETKNNQSQFMIKIDELTTKKDSERALLEILKENLIEVLIRNSSDKDVENFFLLTFGIIRRLSGNSNRQEVVERLLSVLTTTKPLTTKAQLRLSLINIFYNSLLPSSPTFATSNSNPTNANPKSKQSKKGKKQQNQNQSQSQSQASADEYFTSNFSAISSTLHSLVTYSFQSNQSQIILPLIPSIIQRLESFPSSSSQLQSFLSSLLSFIPHSSPLYFSVSLQLLSTFSEISDSLLQTINSLISLIFTNLSFIVHIDQLLSIPLISTNLSQITAPSPAASAYQTLVMLSSGSILDLKSNSIKTNSITQWLESNNIKLETATTKMRLLELTNLSANGREVTYDELATRLALEGQKSDEEVERWVVQGIEEGMMEGRMDQVKRVVIVDKVAKRRFGREDWEEMGKKLGSWKKTVGDLMKMVDSRKSGSAAS